MILAYQHIQICCKCNIGGFFNEISEEFLAVRRRCGKAECLHSKRSFFDDIEGLHNGVENFSVAIEQLKVSEEIVSCFEVICYAITGMKQSVDERIEQLIEINKE